MTQKYWRKDKRTARKELSVSDKEKCNQKIAETVLATKEYQQAQSIGAYLSLPEEVSVETIIKSAWADDKSVYLPVVVGLGEPLKFAPYYPDSIMTKDILDIEIPSIGLDDYIDAIDIDVVITPLVAFDENHNRIGMGGGFYDQTFAFKKDAKITESTPTLIGVAFEIQKVEEGIDANEWDVRPDSIVSDVRKY